MPMNYMKTAMLLAALTALFVALGAPRRRPIGHGHRLRDRARHERVQPVEGRHARAAHVPRARGR